MKKYVSVQFYPNSSNDNYTKTYQFLTDIDNLALGDAVVVDTQKGLTIAYVVGYDELSKINDNNIKWVVQKIDLEKYNSILVREEKIKELKQKMEVRRKKLEEIQIFEILAKEDPDMKLLLDEFNEIKY